MADPDVTPALNIALVSMPGGGKSTVGRQLARRLNWRFVDSDTEIEKRVGCSIRSFFEREGEAHFRDVEEQVLEGFGDLTQCVLATGGGVVLRDTNRSLLRRLATVVYLRSTPEHLFQRLRHDAKRPLLQVADPLSMLRQMYLVRDPLYRETAHFHVDTGRPSVPALVNMVLMQLELAGIIDPKSPGSSGSPSDR